MSGREAYGMENHQNPTANLANNMRLAFNSDGGAGALFNQPDGSFQGTTATTAGSLPDVMPSQDGTVKRKRGRPRKYALDGTPPQRPTPQPPQQQQQQQQQLQLQVASPTSTGPPTKKARGRPPGSVKKHHDAASIEPTAVGFTGFVPHVMMVKAGEDIFSKIMSFSQHGSQAVCVLSANGAVSNVTLRQSPTSGGTVTYEGRFEILSLSGSFLLSENAGQRSRTGGLSVVLSGPDGNVLGGGVAGLLTAASLVQVVIGSFNADNRRKESKMGNMSDPMSAQPRAPAAIFSPPSQSHGTYSESSGSPLNTGACNNNDPQGMANINWE